MRVVQQINFQTNYSGYSSRMTYYEIQYHFVILPSGDFPDHSVKPNRNLIAQINAALKLSLSKKVGHVPVDR